MTHSKILKSNYSVVVKRYLKFPWQIFINKQQYKKPRIMVFIQHRLTHILIV